VVIPENPTPTTEIPATETPKAEVPKTGDELAVWILATVASGVGLVWLSITGKKRKDDSAQ
jgi:LPXTG-motif cell wall-anchored protein